MDQSSQFAVPGRRPILPALSPLAPEARPNSANLGLLGARTKKLTSAGVMDAFSLSGDPPEVPRPLPASFRGLASSLPSSRSRFAAEDD